MPVTTENPFVAKTDPAMPTVETARPEDETLRLLKEFTAKGTLATMKPEDLRSLIISIVNEKNMITARDEALKSDRIFGDTEGLISNSTAYRVTTVQQLESLVENLKQGISKNTCLVMAVAVAEVKYKKP